MRGILLKDHESSLIRDGIKTTIWRASLNTRVYKPGEVLYGRETYDNVKGKWYYRADGDLRPVQHQSGWEPSIHMPREAARIFLRVKDVQTRRLWSMTNQDLVNEYGYTWEAITAVGWEALGRAGWDSTLKPKDRILYGWDENPWIDVISFETISKEEAEKCEQKVS